MKIGMVGTGAIGSILAERFNRLHEMGNKI